MIDYNKNIKITVSIYLYLQNYLFRETWTSIDKAKNFIANTAFKDL